MSKYQKIIILCAITFVLLFACLAAAVTTFVDFIEQQSPDSTGNLDYFAIFALVAGVLFMAIVSVLLIHKPEK